MSRDDTASSPVPQPDPGVWVLTLPSEHRSVSVARRAVTRHLEQVGLDDIVAAAQLVVSELVANAVLHAGGDVRVEVELIPDGARVAVIDHSHVLPVSAAPSESSMTGRGLQLVQRVAAELGAVATADGKRIWADLVVGWEPGDERVGNPLELWGEEWPDDPSAEILVPVELADVPTGVLLAAKAHVDNLLRECTLATAGADQGVAAGVPLELAHRVAAAVGGFADARMAMKRQALAAARAQQPRVALRLALPPSRAAAAAAYVAAIEEADAYCEAARLLTLASPPTHRVFRRWYVSEVIAQLGAGGTGGPGPTRTFEEALLGEVERLATSTAAAERAGRLAAVTDALARAGTPEAVSTAVLREGVAALGASGGGILLAAGERRLAVPGTVGYDDDLVRRLTDESPDAELPAATALRTGEHVWLESVEDRDRRFPHLAGWEEGTASLCAVPLELEGVRLGALRLSFAAPKLFDEEERRFVLTLAGQAAQALERTRLARDRAELTRRLLVDLVPSHPVAIPGLEVAGVGTGAVDGRADATGAGGAIAATFADLWQAGPQAWAFGLGYADGDGPAAVAATVMARCALLALAADGTDPADAVRRVGTVLAGSAGATGGCPCRVTFGVVQTGGDRPILRWAGDGLLGPFRRDVAGAGPLHPSVTVAATPAAAADIPAGRRPGGGVHRLRPGEVVAFVGLPASGTATGPLLDALGAARPDAAAVAAALRATTARAAGGAGDRGGAGGAGDGGDGDGGRRGHGSAPLIVFGPAPATPSVRNEGPAVEL